MTISIIVPFYGFQHQREQALNSLFTTIEAQDLRICDAGNNPTEEKDFEVIFVEQTCAQGAHTNIPQKSHIKHIILPAQHAFNKSWCMNVGAKAAKTDNLVFLDVDMIFDKTFFCRINNLMSTTKLKFFLCWTFILSLPGKDQPVARLINKSVMTAGGAFFVNRAFFWSAGGMNENYFGYGGEDNDLWVRVNELLGDKGLYNITAMQGAIGHWYHDWAEPSPERFYHLNRTVQYIVEVSRRLRATTLGVPTGPTLVDMSDLALKEAGIEEKDGKGLV